MNLWPHSQVDIKNQGKTALQVAAHQGHMEVVKALLQANSSIEVKDEDGDTALHYAAFGWGHPPPHTHTKWLISQQDAPLLFVASDTDVQ